MEISLCGAVDLLAAIYGADRYELRKRYGIVETRPVCLQCGQLLKGTTNRRKFCNNICRREYHNPLVVCDGCGRSFHRMMSQILSYPGRKDQNDHAFCSKKCSSRYAGKHYGFAAHPENSNHKRKYDYDFVWSEHLRTGFGYNRLSRLLSIPIPAMGYILHKMRSKP